MKKLTEKKLLDNYDGLSNGGMIISKIEGKNIFWNYRNDGCVCSRKNADCITIQDYDGNFTDIPNSEKWKNHKNSIKIRMDEAILFPVD